VNRADRAVLNEIIDEKLKEFEGEVRSAAIFVMHEVSDLDGGGIEWADEFLRNCLLNGIAQVVSARKRSQRVVVGSDPMPANYTTSNGLVSWLDAPIDDLDLIIDRLDKRSGSLEDHAGILVRARDLARKHGVETAAEAYRLEGITVTELAS
jgi:hypothetical protein